MIGRGGSWTRVMYMCSTLKAPPHRHTHWHSTTVTNPNYNYCLQAVFPRQPAQSQLERKRGRLPCTRSHAQLPHRLFPIRSNKMWKLDTRCSMVKDLLHVQEKVNVSSSVWCEVCHSSEADNGQSLLTRYDVTIWNMFDCQIPYNHTLENCY